MIDLHTHSTESDGSYTPAELVKLAADRGIKILALTDHDTIAGNTAAAQQARQSGIRFIPGVEMEIKHELGEIHLLGLGLVKDLGEFKTGLARSTHSRIIRNRQIRQKMEAAGILVTDTDLAEVVRGSVVGRPHFARILVARGVVATIDEAFKHYLGTGKPFFVGKKTPSLYACIQMIKRAGGISVLAHPITLQLTPRKLKQYLMQWKKQGLDGIEAFHPEHKIKFSLDLEKFGIYNKFIVTGGSDFHGTARLSRHLGHATADLPIPERLAQYFL